MDRLLLGLHHLRGFSVVESWSGYFHATDPTGKRAITAPYSANVHALIAGVAADAKRRHTFIAFYVGKSDPIFVAENEQVDHRAMQLTPREVDVFERSRARLETQGRFPRLCITEFEGMRD